MSVRTDPLFSVFGRYEGRDARRAGHHDRLAHRHGGRCRALRRQPRRARRHRRRGGAARPRASGSIMPSRCAAFGEEEGSRFSAHILTSSALIGAVGPELLDARTPTASRVREALAAAGGDAEAYRACVAQEGRDRRLSGAAHRAGAGAGGAGMALAAVTAINGSVRSHRHRDGLCRPRRHGADGCAPRCARPRRAR